MRELPGQTTQEESLPRFGNYDLLRRIDVGGMGEVYLAHQRSAFGRDVAIKIIRSDLVHDVTARERFLREAEVSAHLKHEHILPLFEFGEEQGRLFLVTPYIQGGTLARRLQSGPLPLAQVRLLFSALVQAVAYIHKRAERFASADELLRAFERACRTMQTGAVVHSSQPLVTDDPASSIPSDGGATFLEPARHEQTNPADQPTPKRIPIVKSYPLEGV